MKAEIKSEEGMKKGRIDKLRSYWNAKYYSTGMVRWLLTDKNGCSVSCDRCGNIANGIMKVERRIGVFNIPLCKEHFGETFPNFNGYLPTAIIYNKPKKNIDPMKILILILFLPISAYSQTHTSFLTEIGTTDFKSQSYAGMIGFTNFQDDSFHAGLLYKNYGKANRIGARVNVNLNLNRAMFVFIQSDIFGKVAKQDNASFMENSAGLGFRLFKGFSGHFGYQMEDYNPVTKERREDRPIVKLSYKFKL